MKDVGAHLEYNVTGVNDINELEEELVTNETFGVDFHHPKVSMTNTIIDFYLSPEIILIHFVI